MELAEVPAGYLADDIVQGRLKEGRCGLGDSVLQVEQPVAQAQFGRHESQRIARGLGSESRGTAEACIDLYDAIVLGLGVEGILHIAFAHYAYVAYDAYGQFAQLVVFAVAERLRRCYDDGLARVDAQRIEVLHIADGDTVVKAVAYHLILYLFPSLQALLYEHLWRERKCLFAQEAQLALVVAKA